MYRIAALALWVYVLLRAIYMPITHDEAATFFHYIQSGEFIPPNAHWDANNHILNSLFSWLSYSVFGPELWALRLPNVLAFGLLIVAAEGICKFINGRWSRYAFMVGMLGSQFFLDYFSINRGYGLSMALFVAAVWQLMELTRSVDWRNFARTLVFSLLAVSANLSLLVCGLLIWTMALVVWSREGGARSREAGVRKRKLGILVTSVLVGGIAWRWLINIALEFKDRDLLYYGGQENIVDNTLTSLSDHWISSSVNGMGMFLLVLVVVVIAEVLSRQYNRRTFLIKFKEDDVPGLLLTGSFISILTMHFILGVNYPEDRTALYLVPLLVMGLAFIDHRPLGKVLGLLPLFFLLQFPLKANLTHTIFWNDEHIPDRFAKHIEKWQQSNHKMATIAGYFGRWLPWSYKNYVSRPRFNQVHYLHYPDSTCDFQIVDRSDHPEYWGAYHEVIYDDASGLSLLQRGEPLPEKEIIRADGRRTGETTAEFVNVLDSGLVLEKGVYRMAINAFILHDEIPLYSWMVITVSDEEGNDLVYEHVPLNWLSPVWRRYNFYQEFTLPVPKEGMSRVLVYFWNRKEQQFSAHVSALRLSKVESLLYSNDDKVLGHGN